jgi:hypothetical protein
MEQEVVTHLGLVLDADDPQTDGLGFAKTWGKTTAVLAKEGHTK